jgi:hypothetical protein
MWLKEYVPQNQWEKKDVVLGGVACYSETGLWEVWSEHHPLGR